MKPRKKKKEKKAESFLTRLMKGGQSQGKGKKRADRSKNGKAATNGRTGVEVKGGEGKAKPLTPLERSIQEIKHMAGVGSKDPERLAMILSTVLSVEQEKTRKDQEKFDNMVWDIVKRSDEGGGDSGSEGSDR